jgi:hypothetical protein
MKTVSKLVGIIAFVAIIGLGFIGCPPADDGGDNGGNGNGSTSIPETNVQVYNKDGTPYTGGGTIKYRSAGDEKTIDAGIVTDGKLTLSLPSSSEMISFYGSTVNNFMYDTLYLYPGPSNTRFKLDYKGQTGNKSYSVWYTYFKTDGKTNQTDDLHDYVYQIDVKAGWGKLLRIYESPKTTITSKLSGMPSDMRWTLDN